MKKVIVSVTNDLVSDNRVHKVCTSLESMGYHVLLVGRRQFNSLSVNRNYKTKRFRLLFNKGPLFYAEYNFRLFHFLLFSKANIFLANDLDSLYANYLASKIRKKILVYDSHEYFTEVPELIGRNFARNFLLRIEKRIVPKLKYCYTVCQSLSDEYFNRYKVRFSVVRNVPTKYTNSIKLNKKIFPEGKKIIIYQGALNIGRGIETVIKAVKFIENVYFVIIGDGDIREHLKELVLSEDVSEKVFFTGKIPLEELREYTMSANLGISLEENMGLNYYYSLPNKIFDYIQAGIPVLASDFPEMKRIVENYNVGKCTLEKDPKMLALIINTMLFDDKAIAVWKENLKKAATELNWENEEKFLKGIFEKFT
ncbi:MAG: glycosyltransferase [Bacteroidia bacterium]|nr:glycosyltransferase [Bacteroidia bacterium]